MGNSEFSVPEQLIGLSSINSEYVHAELTCMRDNYKKPSSMELRYYDSPWQPVRKMSYVTSLELKVLIHADGEYEKKERIAAESMC